MTPDTVAFTWDSYEIYDPGVFGPMHTLPRREARGAYNRLMAAKPARIEMLRKLLKANGAVLSSTDDGLRTLNAWFLANLEPDPDKPGRLLPEWYSVVLDIGLFLGEVMIERCPELHWEFYIWGKKNVAYQEHVIMGFTQVPNPRFNVEFTRTIGGYGHSIVESRGSIGTQGKVTVRGVEIDPDAAHASFKNRPIENDWFWRWVKIAESYTRCGRTDADGEVDRSSFLRTAAVTMTPLAFLDDLAKVGIEIESHWDLVNHRPYKAAIPVLLHWLDRIEVGTPSEELVQFREWVVRALAIPAARGVAAQALIREFRRDEASLRYRWTVSDTLKVVAEDSVFDELVSIAQDQSYGIARQMVVEGLGKMKDPRAVEVLIGLLDDDDVAGHAVIALGKSKAPQSRSAIEPFLDHPRPWVRKEAKKALAKIKD